MKRKRRTRVHQRYKNELEQGNKTKTKNGGNTKNSSHPKNGPISKT